MRRVAIVALALVLAGVVGSLVAISVPPCDMCSSYCSGNCTKYYEKQIWWCPGWDCGGGEEQQCYEQCDIYDCIDHDCWKQTFNTWWCTDSCVNAEL